jgi:branched-chain amino acid transport system substrate-binding protein
VVLISSTIDRIRSNRRICAILTEVTHLNPDSFVAFSYPPDTIAITEQARAWSFNPKVFHTAVATAFPLYKQRFGADVEGVMGLGGWNAMLRRARAI